MNDSHSEQVQFATSEVKSFREHAPAIEVIGLGLGRTGTFSLCKALEILGLGPCWHPLNVDSYEKKRWEGWIALAEEDSSPEKCDSVLEGYRSAVDGPAAIVASSLLTAYPHAKFILTTRDPESWAESVKSTIFGMYEQRKRIRDPHSETNKLWRWLQVYFDGYHSGRILDHAEEEFIKHEEYIKKIVPPSQLLIYHVGEGWDPLINFLGVPKPTELFPRTNERAEMANRIAFALQTP